MSFRISSTLLALCGLVSATACQKETSQTASTETVQKPAKAVLQTLVVYSGRSEALVGPVLEKFDKANPDIKLDVRYNKTPALASQVLTEGKECPADFIWFQDSGYLGALSDAGLLATLAPKLTSQVPAHLKDAANKWFGVTGRLRVLVYNVDKVKPEDLPKSLADLADKKYKGKLGWAPANASLHAHVSALRHLWGEEKTKAWLSAVKANEPGRYPKNSPQVQAAHSGEIEIGWVNHYYLHKLKKGGFKAANYSFSGENDAGNVLMISGAAIREGAKHRAAAERLGEYLLSKETQTYFAQKAFEYPVVGGVATHSDVPALSTVSLAKVQQKHLADIKPTLQMLEALGLE